MTEKLKFTRAQMRNAAIIAKEEGVSITLAPDGSMSVLPVLPANKIKLSSEQSENCETLILNAKKIASACRYRKKPSRKD